MDINYELSAEELEKIKEHKKFDERMKEEKKNKAS